MGNQHSTKSSEDEKGTNKKKSKGRHNESKQIQVEIEKDLNNNNLREVTPVTPVVLPNAKSSTKSIIPLHYIKSKISRFFHFRAQTVGKAVMTEDINANFPGSPLIRNVQSAKNASALWKESRPFTPQMPNFQTADVIPVTDQNNDVKSATAPPLKRSSNETTTSSASGTNSSPTRNNKSHSKDFIKSTKRSFGNPRSNRTINNPIENSNKGGLGRACICRPVAPPVYLDYGAASRSGNTQNVGNGSGERNPIIDRLQNVDVIEELQYHVPGGDCRNSDDDEFEYFYCCDGCGEMEQCENPKLKEKHGGGKPVTYSRRQRFNFNNNNNDNNDGQPFRLPNSQCCPCTCCRAGLRRNANCECQCCGQKGRSRVSNPFDEIPVGKNPELKPWTYSEETINEEDKENWDKILPCGSGVYFYDARKCKFIRQVPRTQTPVILENEFDSTGSSQPTTTADTEPCPDITQVIGSLPSKRPPVSKRERSDPEPIILPPIFGGSSFKYDDNEPQQKITKHNNHESNSSVNNEATNKPTTTEQRKSENGSDASSYSISSYSTSSSSSSGTYAKRNSKEIKTQKL